jgi:MEMO1 family protein
MAACLAIAVESHRGRRYAAARTGDLAHGIGGLATKAMKQRFVLLTATVVLAATSWVRPAAAPGSTAPEAARIVRPPAVAGLFYPRDPAALARAVDLCLNEATTERKGQLKALICPHAGYSYSGPVAGSGFRLLRGTDFSTIVLLGPSHYARLRLASVSAAEGFRTPLGDMAISPEARQLAQTRPFALDPACIVDRPDWAGQSSRPEPANGRETADTWEHSVEVEVPFLQRTLPRASLVPVVMGDADPAAAARALEPLLKDQTLIVVSSDLSHYHPYAEARKLDRSCTDAVCALDVDRMETQEACGRIPILTVMHIARHRGWKPVLLDYRNSGDTSGDKSRVVGYAAIAFYGSDSIATASTGAPPTAMLTAAPAAPVEPANLSADERKFLLGLARSTVREVVSSGKVPDVPAAGVGPALTAPKACFVTLTKRGELRGCIGHLTAIMPLYRAVVDNARNAALRDPRFPPVTWREVDQLAIEISVLTEPQPLAFSSPDDLLRKLQPRRDGVILQIGGHTATYLPQVWDQIPDKTAFLDSLAEKAGLSAGDWRQRGTKVFIYHVESFHDTDV